MKLHRIIRRIGIWWFARCQRARLDSAARERRRAIAKAQRAHKAVKPLYEAQKAHMSAKLRGEA